jgi:hypothetical protein
MMLEVDSLSRAFAAERPRFVAADSEVKRIVAALGTTRPPAADTLVKRVDSIVAVLRGRMSAGYSAPLGQAFDLLGGLESSSMPPTDAERRTLDAAIADLRETFTKLDGFLATDLPRLRALTPPKGA